MHISAFAANSHEKLIDDGFFAGQWTVVMLHYPEVMKKAQAEIDSVVGPSRMPEFKDMDSLPYVLALMKEVVRWVIVLPRITITLD